VRVTPQGTFRAGRGRVGAVGRRRAIVHAAAWGEGPVSGWPSEERPALSHGACQSTLPSLSNSTREDSGRFSTVPVRAASRSVAPSAARDLPFSS